MKNENNSCNNSNFSQADINTVKTSKEVKEPKDLGKSIWLGYSIFSLLVSLIFAYLLAGFSAWLWGFATALTVLHVLVWFMIHTLVFW